MIPFWKLREWMQIEYSSLFEEKHDWSLKSSKINEFNGYLMMKNNCNIGN